MENPDDIVILQCKNIGIKIERLEEFTAESFIKAIIMCFQQIAEMLTE
jgi:hypothetical protein